MEEENVTYLYEVEGLLGGEGLSTYDLTLIASKSFKWHEEGKGGDKVDIAAWNNQTTKTKSKEYY